jgi:hypothetical protein
MSWEITGNSDVNPDSGHFLGTIDQSPLAIRTSNKEALRVDPAGNVGIGTSNPSSKLEIHAQEGLQIVGFQPLLILNDSHSGKRARIQTADGNLGFLTENSLSTGVAAMEIKDATNTVEIHAQEGLRIVGFQPLLTLLDSNSGKRARIATADGNLGFHTESSISSGMAPVEIKNGSGDVVLRGDLILSGADCAEHFTIANAEQIDAGTVVVINQGGTLRQSRKAYDRKVAGVVSGAGDYRPGIVLDKQQSSENRLPISLMGKVYCKVDAQYSSIELGDMLTTSPTPGHAMKAADPEKAFGAVIGKALGPLKEGQGLIPILITLQ